MVRATGTVNRLGSGDYFGELAMGTGKGVVRLASVVAISDTSLLLIPKLAYIRLELGAVVETHVAERRDGLRRCALFDDFSEAELEAFVKVVRIANPSAYK